MKDTVLTTIQERVFITLSLCVLLFLLLSSVFRESLIFDENLHVVAGYTFLTSHDFFEEPYNPPLPREIIALPELINHNLANDPIFFWQRMTVIIATLVFAVTLFVISKKLYGQKSALLALVLFIFEPNILAHGHYAATDLILTLFYFLSVTIFWLWRFKLTKKRLLILGIVWGLTLSCKVSALPFLVFPITILFLVTKKRSRNFLSARYWWQLWKRYRILIASLLMSLWATYFFTFQPALGGSIDPHRRAIVLAAKTPLIHFFLNAPLPLGAYINSIKQILLYNYSGSYVKSAFLYGHIADEGFHYFFPIAFLLKTQIPLLIGLFYSIVYFWRRKKLSETFLLIPISSVMGLAMLSTLNLGVRYILPLYPLIIVFVSQIASIQKYRKKFLICIVIGVLWNILSVVRVYPHYLSFFNEFTSNPTYGYIYLIDSNYDWGQGLVDLAAYQKEHHIKNVQLAYFGMVLPGKYGLTYHRIKDISVGEKKTLSPLTTQKGSIVAISASCYYYCGYYKNPVLQRKPDKIIGGSVLLFNF